MNLLTRTFRIKNDKYPKKARVVGGGGIFPINSVQCLVKKSSDPCRAHTRYAYEGISMTKFNNPKVKRVKSNLKLTKSKLVKKGPR